MKTNKESILTTNLRHPRNPKLVLSGSEFWLLNAQDIQTPVGLETLRGGAAMVLNVPTGNPSRERLAPAWHLAHFPEWSIIRPAAQALHRRSRRGSNDRHHVYGPRNL